MSLVGTWQVRQAIAGQDTVIMRTVSSESGWFEQITGIASGVMTFTLLVLTIALVPAAWNFRKSYARINNLLDRVYGDVTPIVRHASAIADNVDYITTSIRVDVQQINQTIATANQRLQQAMALTEQRLNEFNALLAVVQEEAESAFVHTAATVHGVRTGAAVLQDAMDEEPDEFDDDPAYGAPPGAPAPDPEETDGDGDDAQLALDDPPAPRIRPRAHRRV